MTFKHTLIVGALFGIAALTAQAQTVSINQNGSLVEMCASAEKQVAHDTAVMNIEMVATERDKVQAADKVNATMAQAVREDTVRWRPGDRVALHHVSQAITKRIIIQTVLGVGPRPRRLARRPAPARTTGPSPAPRAPGPVSECSGRGWALHAPARPAWRGRASAPATQVTSRSTAR